MSLVECLAEGFHLTSPAGMHAVYGFFEHKQSGESLKHSVPSKSQQAERMKHLTANKQNLAWADSSGSAGLVYMPPLSLGICGITHIDTPLPCKLISKLCILQQCSNAQ